MAAAALPSWFAPERLYDLLSASHAGFALPSSLRRSRPPSRRCCGNAFPRAPSLRLLAAGRQLGINHLGSRGMGLIKRSPAQLAAKEQQQRAELEAILARKKRAEFEYTWRGFWDSPPGVARRAFANGDHVFQYAIDVMDQTEIMRAMVGSNTRVVKLDPSAVLNAVCREGWELVNGNFVVVRAEEGFREALMGYYLLRRCEENREAETEEQLARRLGWSPTAPDQAEKEVVTCPECGAAFPDLEAYAAHYRSTHQGAYLP